MAKKGNLKYSRKNDSWYIQFENGSIHELSESDLLDVDLKLSDYYLPCAINFQDETINFSNISLRLDSCFDYDIILYLPWRMPEDKFDKYDDIPF